MTYEYMYITRFNIIKKNETYGLDITYKYQQIYSVISLKKLHSIHSKEKEDSTTRHYITML